MKGLNKFALILSKVLEVIHWIGVGFITFLMVCSIVARDWLSFILAQGVSESGTTLSTYGFEITAVNTDGIINMTVVTLFFIGAIFIMALMAMVFRNVYLILKTANGNTKFSQGNTPFQKDIVRMLREIGIFTIAVPIVGLLMSIIIGVVTGINANGFTEVNVNLESVIMGILCLCLSQFFAYGTELQQDVDGLL